MSRRRFSLSDLDWLDLGGTGWQRASITLEEGESSFSTIGSADNCVAGPATVTYEKAPSGSISMTVERPA